MLAFLNTPTFPVFSPPTYFNPAFILRFYLSFIFYLAFIYCVLLFTNIIYHVMRTDTCNKPHTLRDAVTGRNRNRSIIWFVHACRPKLLFSDMNGPRCKQHHSHLILSLITRWLAILAFSSYRGIVGHITTMMDYAGSIFSLYFLRTTIFFRILRIVTFFISPYSFHIGFGVSQ